MKRTIRSAAAFALASMALVACGDAPDSSPSSSSSKAGSSDFLACMVSDAGGVDDKSFNETAWKGLEDAKKDYGIETNFVESTNESDFVPNVTQQVNKECKLIVTVGFSLGDATKAAAESNPDERFAIVDFAYDAPIDNVRPLTFNTQEAAYLAGYAAAAVSKTATVGTFGGKPIPTVTVFMDGFVQGVQKFNADNGKDVKVVGWDMASKSGVFADSFDDITKGQTSAKTLMDQGADVIMPVAGPVGQGAAQAAKDATAQGKDVLIVGVDSDWYLSNPTYKDVTLTSVMKGIDVAVESTVKDMVNGDGFKNEPFVGTLENDGVKLAPFHDFESKVPADLQGKLDALKEQIVKGEIKVEVS